MDQKAKTFLFDLLDTPSPTGFEIAGQRKWAAYVKRFADRVESDAYGSAWATLDGSAKKPRRVMLEAHADEIGFIVKHITKEGWLRLDRVPGFNRIAVDGSGLSPRAMRLANSFSSRDTAVVRPPCAASCRR